MRPDATTRTAAKAPTASGTTSCPERRTYRTGSAWAVHERNDARELAARRSPTSSRAASGRPMAPRTAQHRLATTSGGEEIARDAHGNAVVVDFVGDPAPRLPYVELGEATFITGLSVATSRSRRRRPRISVREPRRVSGGVRGRARRTRRRRLQAQRRRRRDTRARRALAAGDVHRELLRPLPAVRGRRVLPVSLGCYRPAAAHVRSAHLAIGSKSARTRWVARLLLPRAATGGGHAASALAVPGVLATGLAIGRASQISESAPSLPFFSPSGGGSGRRHLCISLESRGAKLGSGVPGPAINNRDSDRRAAAQDQEWTPGNRDRPHVLSAHPRALRASDRCCRLRAQARRPLLVLALPLRGLRPPAALANGQELAAARDPRRRPRR